jgi:peptidoglycan hydrolase-like protein with peptidoglycan-binding domain
MTSQVARARSHPRIQLPADDTAPPAPAATPAAPKEAETAATRAVDASTQQGARNGAQVADARRAQALPSTSESAGLGSTPTLRRGDEGEHVQTLQRQLGGLGYDIGEPDGKFGRKTERAVRDYQDDKGMTSDGVVGPRTHAKLRADAPQTVSPTAPTTATAPATSNSNDARAVLAKSLNGGYQYLIGNDFPTAAAQLKSAGAKGAAIVDRASATPQSVAALKASGVQPYAYNNAFQTQPGESVPSGVKTLSQDTQWKEAVPDFANKKWQDRRIGEAKDAAKMGFAGLMLDNVPRAESNPAAAAQYIKRMAVEAREASGNNGFGLILQNGQDLVKQHPWLVDEGFVSSVQKEDVSFHATGEGTGTGAPTSREELKSTKEAVSFMRDRWPDMPLISVDYPKDRDQAAASVRRSKEVGFHVAHVAVGDGALNQISNQTKVVRRVPE